MYGASPPSIKTSASGPRPSGKNMNRGTGELNGLVALVHSRTPVILPEEHHAVRLREADVSV